MVSLLFEKFMEGRLLLNLSKDGILILGQVGEINAEPGSEVDKGEVVMCIALPHPPPLRLSVSLSLSLPFPFPAPPRPVPRPFSGNIFCFFCVFRVSIYLYLALALALSVSASLLFIAVERPVLSHTLTFH